MELQEQINNDIYRYYEKYSLSFIQKMMTNKELKAIIKYRKAKYYSQKFLLNYYYKYKHRRYCEKYNCQIPYSLEIGNGFYIGHLSNIIINPRTVIGKNVNIAQGVTIGQENRGKRKGTPIISDEVWIGANAVIVGKITIGKDVLIAPNSFVNFDVPDHSIVIGNPGKIIHKENATEDYINRKVK